ncbi:MAG: hypothetical protein V4549_18185 [Bacteroidota bacterium]
MEINFIHTNNIDLDKEILLILCRIMIFNETNYDRKINSDRIKEVIKKYPNAKELILHFILFNYSEFAESNRFDKIKLINICMFARKVMRDNGYNYKKRHHNFSELFYREKFGLLGMYSKR